MTHPSSPDNAIAVDPARLAPGTWCHRTNKEVGKGDIAGSYSADRIGMGKPVRTPFTWRGSLHVCVGIAYRKGGVQAANVYRLVHPQVFSGDTLTYGERVANGDAARADPNGFYHGMQVKHAGQTFILCGPEVTFVPGEVEQPSLF